VSLVLVAAGVALLLLPMLAAGASRQLSPAECARLAVGATWLGLRSIQAGLLLTAAPTVLRTVGVDAVADACHRVLGPTRLGGSAVAWASAAAFVVLTRRARVVRARAHREQRQAHIEPWLGHHERIDGIDVVVLPTDQVLAYSAPGPPPQVVLSEGLTAALTDEELSAVIRHEQTHLRNRHDRHLVLAAVVEGTFGWLPGARRSAYMVRLGLERWADEVAADRPGGREQIRRALLKTTELLLDAVPAFSPGCTLVERLTALEAPRPHPSVRQRALVGALAVGGTALALTSLVAGTVDSHHAFLGLLDSCRL
jgi:beta-lactamase regulating signal transducer with metallopeptidase domain